jgi:hypothetical protein
MDGRTRAASGGVLIVLIGERRQLIDLASDRIRNISPLPKSAEQLQGYISLFIAVKITLKVQEQV